MPLYNIHLNDSPASTPTVTRCRCCGSPMQRLHRPAAIQTNSLGQTRVIPASTPVTCHNPACQLNGFTFEASTYHNEDLTRYGVSLAVAK